MRNGNLTPTASATALTMPYNSYLITNTNYSWSGSTLTIATAGTYLISASINMLASSYADRVTGRLRTLVNNTYVAGADAEAFFYLMSNAYGNFESCIITQFPRVFAAGDTLEIQITVRKAAETPAFTSTFSGLLLAGGNSLTVEKIN